MPCGEHNTEYGAHNISAESKRSKSMDSEECSERSTRSSCRPGEGKSNAVANTTEGFL
jgi:hypothetical protein